MAEGINEARANRYAARAASVTGAGNLGAQAENVADDQNVGSTEARPQAQVEDAGYHEMPDGTKILDGEMNKLTSGRAPQTERRAENEKKTHKPDYDYYFEGDDLLQRTFRNQIENVRRRMPDVKGLGISFIEHGKANWKWILGTTVVGTAVSTAAKIALVSAGAEAAVVAAGLAAVIGAGKGGATEARNIIKERVVALEKARDESEAESLRRYNEGSLNLPTRLEELSQNERVFSDKIRLKEQLKNLNKEDWKKIGVTAGIGAGYGFVGFMAGVGVSQLAEFVGVGKIFSSIGEYFKGLKAIGVSVPDVAGPTGSLGAGGSTGAEAPTQVATATAVASVTEVPTVQPSPTELPATSTPEPTHTVTALPSNTPTPPPSPTATSIPLSPTPTQEPLPTFADKTTPTALPPSPTPIPPTPTPEPVVSVPTPDAEISVPQAEVEAPTFEPPVEAVVTPSVDVPSAEVPVEAPVEAPSGESPTIIELANDQKIEIPDDAPKWLQDANSVDGEYMQAVQAEVGKNFQPWVEESMNKMLAENPGLDKIAQDNLRNHMLHILESHANEVFDSNLQNALSDPSVNTSNLDLQTIKDSSHEALIKWFETDGSKALFDGGKDLLSVHEHVYSASAEFAALNLSLPVPEGQTFADWINSNYQIDINHLDKPHLDGLDVFIASNYDTLAKDFVTSYPDTPLPVHFGEIRYLLELAETGDADALNRLKGMFAGRAVLGDKLNITETITSGRAADVIKNIREFMKGLNG